MSKILLIEPHRLLRQAITLSLFPDHEVDLPEKTKGSGMESLDDYDLIVVDGAALRESGQLSTELSRALQSATTPMIWLEEDDGAGPVKRENLVVVKKPVERELFQSAVNNFLSPSQSARGDKSSMRTGAQKTEETPGKATKKARAEDPQQPTLQFIELVDVVEDEPADKQQRKTPRKSQ
jgi:hypothetical protein